MVNDKNVEGRQREKNNVDNNTQEALSNDYDVR